MRVYKHGCDIISDLHVFLRIFFFCVYITSSKYMVGFRRILDMQTLDCVLGLHNWLEFSQPSLI